MRKYLELFANGFDATLAEKTKVENRPYVGYSPSEGVVFTVIPKLDETRMVLTEDSGGEVTLSANGLVIVEYMQGGEKVRNTYSALSQTYVPIPAGVEATIYGAVTFINRTGDFNIFSSLDVSKNPSLTGLKTNRSTGLTSLDVSKNNALTSLDCSNCTGLTSLDVSKNNALIYLDCNGCSGLMLLDIQNTQALSEGVILDQSMANLSTLQVAGTSAWAYGQLENWFNDFAPNDGMLYVDENTPQSVIEAAETKDWEIIY